jgi:hypothetical protein
MLSIGKPFDMRPNLLVSLCVLPIVLTLSACQGDSAETAFVENCDTVLGQDRPKLCSCIYAELKEKFEPAQMTRISGLFEGNINDAEELLRESGSESDLDILARINTVEEATQVCFNKLK